jgi:predicted phage tail protein
MIVAGILIPGAQFLIGSGIAMVLSGVAQLFIKAPSLSKDTDPDASKYLGLSDNTTKLGTLRSYSMGRIKISAPHVIAVNVDANDLVKGEFPA